MRIVATSAYTSNRHPGLAALIEHLRRTPPPADTSELWLPKILRD